MLGISFHSTSIAVYTSNERGSGT
ncbi:unnamed protein product, partial [Didymodactylos carnosus]